MATSYKYVKVKDGAGRGIMGLWRRGSQYYAQIDVPTPDGGKKTTKINLESSGTNEAKRKLEELKERIRSGKFLSPVINATGYTLKSYIEHYLSTVIKKPGTIFREKYFLNDWLKHLGDIPINNISTNTILLFQSEQHNRGLSPRTINLRTMILRNLFKMAKQEGVVTDSPTDGIKQLVSPYKSKKLLSKDEVEKIFAAAKSFKKSGILLHDYLRLLCFSGGRKTEVLKLTWEDIDFENKRLRFIGTNTKNSETRYVQFNPQLESLLQEMVTRKNGNNLFPSDRTEGVVLDFKKSLEKIQQQTGIEFHAHLFRHYFISQCVMAGFDYLSIARWVGHRDGGMLIGKVYGHLSDSHLVGLANKLKL